jgi:UDP-N-acetyl-2-amino-2-deoxyglucuronate dehydrogenase
LATRTYPNRKVFFLSSERIVSLIIDYAIVTLNQGFFAGTPWRHMKGEAGAGWINDHVVHRTHFFTEINGPIDEVFAYTEIFERIK